ncbi:MAG TPA: cupin domain-containing protein [Thermomicrobiales bacterium]|nr:cupin domain-containing protein [Thermomicrobiales bacterium]
MVLENQGLFVPPESGRSVSLGGLEAIFKVPGAQTAGAYAVVEHVLLPGQLGSPPHTHANEDEVSILLEGEIRVLIGEDVFTAGAGAYVVKPRGLPHAFWNATSVPARFVEIVSPPGFEQYFVEVADLLSAAGPPDMGGLARIAGRYGLTMHLERLPELMERFNVRLGP